MRRGASFSAVTVTLTAIGEAEANRPSQALTVNAASVPLASASGVHSHASPGPRVVLPGTTTEPFLASVPLPTDSTRKPSVASSRSASSAASARVW